MQNEVASATLGSMGQEGLGPASEAIGVSGFSIEEATRLAVAHHRAGRRAEAEAICRDLVGRDPKNAELWGMLGTLLIETDRLDRAVPPLKRAAELAPAVARHHANLGEALRRLERYDEAIVAFREALRLDASLAVAHNNLGIALTESGDREGGIAAYRTAARLQPDYAAAHANLGNALTAQGKAAEAIAACRRAVELDPASAVNANSLGAALAAAGQAREAIEMYTRAISIAPDYAEAHSNLGNALTVIGQPAAALDAFRAAVAIAPESIPARWNLAVELLRQGDFEAGWAQHEWRLRTRANAPVRPFAQPQWAGESLGGRTILLHGEQGFGDTLQFVRYVPMVAALGATVVLECQPGLAKLLHRFPARAGRLLGASRCRVSMSSAR